MTVLIEFFQSNEQKYEQTPIEDCILGFLRIILSLQERYKGPLVVILGPVMPYVNEQLDRYKVLKEKAHQNAVFTKAMGRLLGIPLAQTLLQTTYSIEVEGFMRHQWWLNKPIFNRLGQPTEEFYRRLDTELKLLGKERKKWM
jgi:hypothetical protein